MQFPWEEKLSLLGAGGPGVGSSNIKIIPLYSVNQSPVFSGVLALHSLSLSVKRTPGETSPVDHPMGSLRTIRNSKTQKFSYLYLLQRDMVERTQGFTLEISHISRKMTRNLLFSGSWS